MKASALVVGNNNYRYTDKKLNNAINDANAIADKLFQLGFIVEKTKDCNTADFAKALSKFCTELDKFDIALLFFSGHGLQIENQNYLCNVDTQFEDKGSAKYTSILLEEILHDIDKASPKVKIVILDACRDNPFPKHSRGGYTPGLAPIYAPKGSIIAFSTSPGETASDGDGLGGSHSYFTKAILKHIDDKNIPIEEFFKRVRTSVYTMSAGKQLSWEHTSLIGDFFFNSGQLIQSIDLPYSMEVTVDSLYVGKGTAVDKIVADFKSHDWYKQNPAFNRFKRLLPEGVDSNLQFLLGRNLLQTAVGGEGDTNKYFSDLGNNLEKWSKSNKNHILNGILFEIYFDSEGKLRQGMNFKSGQIENVLALEEDERYTSSIKFIESQLEFFRDYVFYIPSSKPKTVPIEVVLEKQEPEQAPFKITYYHLTSFKCKDQELFELKEDDYVSYSLQEFSDKISLRLCIPKNRLSLIYNYNSKDIKRIQAPWIFHFATNQ